MKRDKKSLLQQLYDSEFDPSGDIVPKNPEYRSLTAKICDEMEYISGNLSGDDKARFEELIVLIGQTSSMESYANFAYGFRSGALLMHEIVTGEETPVRLKERKNG